MQTGTSSLGHVCRISSTCRARCASSTTPAKRGATDPRRALEALGDVAPRGVSVAAMVPSLTAVDADGMPCGPGLLYGDERGHRRSADGHTTAEIGELAEFLRWQVEHHPDAHGYWMAQAVANDALTGRPVISTTVAATATPLIVGPGWDEAGVRETGARIEQLPQIGLSGQPLGEVTGYDGCVLEGGTIDAMAEQLVAGADEVGDVLAILGTTLIVWTVVPDLVDVAPLYCVPHTAPGGRWLVGGPSNAGGLFLDWVPRARCARHRGRREHRTRSAPSSPVGSVSARRARADQRCDTPRRTRRSGPDARRGRDSPRRLRGVGVRDPADHRRGAGPGAPHRRNRRWHACRPVGSRRSRTAPDSPCRSRPSPKEARSVPRSSHGWRPGWKPTPAMLRVGRASNAPSTRTRAGSNRRPSATHGSATSPGHARRPSSVVRRPAHGSGMWVRHVRPACGCCEVCGAMALEISIDRELCMGSGNCAFWAPGVFDLDDDGIAVVLDPTAQAEDKIVLAAQGCPTQAIAISRDGERARSEDPVLTRREMLVRSAAAGAGVFAIGNVSTLFAATPASGGVGGFGGLGRLGPPVPDPAGVLDLPRGFRYSIVSRAGDPLTPRRHHARESRRSRRVPRPVVRDAPRAEPRVVRRSAQPDDRRARADVRPEGAGRNDDIDAGLAQPPRRRVRQPRRHVTELRRWSHALGDVADLRGERAAGGICDRPRSRLRLRGRPAHAREQRTADTARCARTLRARGRVCRSDARRPLSHRGRKRTERADVPVRAERQEPCVRRAPQRRPVDGAARRRSTGRMLPTSRSSRRPEPAWTSLGCPCPSPTRSRRRRANSSPTTR